METRTSRGRLGAVALVAALALGGGLAGCSSGTTAAGHLTHDAAAVASVGQVSDSSVPAAQMRFRMAMRLLWNQHMEWTRMAITDFAASSGGFGATAARLLQNQADIGNAIRPFYGDAAANRLTGLLEEHINGFVALLQAAKSNDSAGVQTATAAVYANANAIADFLSSANPKNWPQATLRDMMKGHIDQTIVYATDELTGNYAPGITAYDQAEAHMLMLADLLSTGIIAQFPGAVR
ncbi:hypothetical protein GCM10027449_06170 [Sinomonas notoginsengisoli]|uniref:hypothetical protein n=1 Tax=Sinomonas notoginsengisoli TaxID=1457311 RepID=UPI001F2A4289|nr:hypothetical protein [Sinomonas notoginsengisoli]